MSSKIWGNLAKYYRERRQTFGGISSNIPGNVLKHSGECPQTFKGMLPNILGNVAKHSGECRQTFRGMSVLLKDIKTQSQFKVVVWFCVCGALWANDWANVGSVDVFFTYGEYGFTFKGSWSYSRKWVWNLRTRLCCLASGNWNVSRDTLQEFDIRYIMF